MRLQLGQSMLAEYDTDGFLNVQPDLYGEAQSGTPAAEMHSPYGFYSMPADPERAANGDVKNACTILYGWEGSRVHVFPQQDPRVIAKLPKLKKGGSMQYAATGAYSYFDGDTGSLTAYVPYGFASGKGITATGPTKSMSIELNVDTPGQESISIIHGDGMSITMSQHSLVLKNASGNAYLELNDSGGVLNGAWSVQGGMAVGDVGGAKALASGPATQQILNDLIKIVAAINATTTGAPASALSAQLAGILTKNTRGS